IKNLIKTNKELQETLSKILANISGLPKKKQEKPFFKADYQKDQASIIKKRELQITDLNEELKRRNKLIQHLAAKLRLAQDYSAQANKQLNLLNKKLDSKNRQILLMKKELEKRDKYIQKLAAEKSDETKTLKNTLLKAQEEINLKNTLIFNLEKEVETHKNSLEELKRKLRRLANESYEKEKKITLLKSENSSLANAVRELKQNSDLLSAQVESLKSDLGIARQKIVAVETRARKKEAASKKSLEMLKMEYEKSLKELIKSQSQKEVALKSKINELNEKILNKALLLKKKQEQEKKLFYTFNKALRNLFYLNESELKPMLKKALSQQTQPTQEPDQKEITIHHSSDDNDSFFVDEPQKFHTPIHTPVMHKTVKQVINEDDPLKLLVPMVKTALDHGDSVEQIKHSLLNSGYSEKHIEEALTKVKK
ncbi:hypothetical protein D6745_02540, partial [Candidatus Woesearchaeota archaeon]